MLLLIGEIMTLERRFREMFRLLCPLWRKHTWYGKTTTSQSFFGSLIPQAFVFCYQVNCSPRIDFSQLLYSITRFECYARWRAVFVVEVTYLLIIFLRAYIVWWVLSFLRGAITNVHIGFLTNFEVNRSALLTIYGFVHTLSVNTQSTKCPD